VRPCNLLHSINTAHVAPIKTIEASGLPCILLHYVLKRTSVTATDQLLMT